MNIASNTCELLKYKIQEIKFKKRVEGPKIEYSSPRLMGTAWES